MLGSVPGSVPWSVPWSVRPWWSVPGSVRWWWCAWCGGIVVVVVPEGAERVRWCGGAVGDGGRCDGRCSLGGRCEELWLGAGGVGLGSVGLRCSDVIPD